MGSFDSKVKQIVDYYLLQKKLHNLSKGNDIEEEEKMRNGYIVSTSLLMNWRANMHYNIISKYLDSMNIDSLKEDELK